MEGDVRARASLSCNLERLAMVTLFGGAAWVAWQCPCDPIFLCHRGLIVKLLVGALLWIGVRTATAPDSK